MEYTTGKWFVEQIQEGGGLVLVNEHLREIACISNDDKFGANNARRIIATVNACDGISTEALEAGIVKELLEACKELLQVGLCDICYEDQCDLSWCECKCHARILDVQERARRVIAKAEGEE